MLTHPLRKCTTCKKRVKILICPIDASQEPLDQNHFISAVFQCDGCVFNEVFEEVILYSEMLALLPMPSHFWLS